MLCIGLCHFYFYNHIGGKRGLVALLCLISWCLLIVMLLFPTVPWVGLQNVIVVFPLFYSWAMSLEHPSLGFARVKGSTQSAELARLARILKC